VGTFSREVGTSLEWIWMDISDFRICGKYPQIQVFPFFNIWTGSWDRATMWKRQCGPPATHLEPLPTCSIRGRQSHCQGLGHSLRGRQSHGPRRTWVGGGRQSHTPFGSRGRRCDEVLGFPLQANRASPGPPVTGEQVGQVGQVGQNAQWGPDRASGASGASGRFRKAIPVSQRTLELRIATLYERRGVRIYTPNWHLATLHFTMLVVD
jgi:hypothetical protein